MKTKTIYLLAIVFLIASCAGKQQDKPTTEAEQVKTTENEVQTESSEDLNSEDTETITTEVELQNSTELSIEDKKKFLGTWKAEGDNPYTVFTLEFSADNKGEISAKYYDGGPFEVNFTCNFISSNKAELYFDYVAGSISFNEITDANATNANKNNKVKIIECKLINEKEIKVNTFDSDKITHVPQSKNLSLFKFE